MKASLKSLTSSIIGQFTLATIMSSCLLVGGVLYDSSHTLKVAVLENVKSSIDQTSQILNLTVSTYASANDLETVRIFFHEMLDQNSQNGLTYLIVGNAEGRVLLTTLESVDTIPTPDTTNNLDVAALRGFIHIRSPLLLPGREVGFLQYGLSTKNLVDAATKEKTNSLIRTGLVMLSTMIVILLLGRRIAKRLNDLIRASKEIVSGRYERNVKVSGTDELAIMASNFNLMAEAVQTKIREITELNRTLETRVSQRTKELEEANRLLGKNFDQLKETQTQLIKSEKLASLGALVAGVSHELNTPIGNALTVSTTLSHKTGEVKQVYQHGQIKKSTLDEFLIAAEEAGDLLSKNLLRASELIISFKTVAVDQTSEQRRRFNLLQTMSELAVTLRPTLKKTKLIYEIQISEDILLDSYPGPLIQVITNLFNNAIVHAFEGRDIGVMSLSGGQDPTDPSFVVLTFKDDGIGIQQNNLEKIFDPFYTTKLGQGGSGLGLNICYNIVEGLLGGHISVSSELGVGTQFKIRIPSSAPHKTIIAELS
ncbi:ATP-binding protein [Undibacterium sp. RTI2.2]|uniref:sensor histidine kinase n=2 Tax=unclassified Undibacterium TaxID=2630295 RepID=UPI002AB4DDCD|nr:MULTISPECIES: ATP-binding protein [unclassified Undibacterium]MDY7537361.1 ATP-binding protein [Undibacterium sp. 5I1]MEB0118829.1 ATP-binding protein [Undibacterium sp. RTI2.2]MEB0232987.1 ATP-binding protein [Undibacterium sp. 10I3]MEB0259761.1 ATP-binding protein [Undibacterium sp. 5I1]